MAEKQIKQTYTILVVDDDELTRSMYSERLEMEEEFDVITAIDGLDALDKLHGNKVHLVFTGIVMPRMDGFKLIESMKEDVALSKIPIMISSHLGRQGDKERADELSVRQFIVRGETTPNDVVNIIRSELLSKRDQYKLRICPDSPDYQVFLQSFFGLDCNHCSPEEQLPVTLTVETTAANHYTFSVKLDCDRCNQ